MVDSPAVIMIKQYLRSHQRILTFLQKLSDEQLHWRIAPGSHSIAFHAWHIGRWTDYTQAAIPGMTPELGRRLPPGVQIWQTEGLAERWKFNTAELGYAETGMSMPDEIAMGLPFPAKAILLDYIEKTFTVVEQAVNVIDDQLFQSAEQVQPMTQDVWGEGTVGDAIVVHIIHDNRHLGMMECLLGLQPKELSGAKPTAGIRA